ncbi:hypothetical protein mRhiFer1_009247 [Rhinolophus ferrumequinum]|uniref:Uncharacterized protein n=1 Tax=Rhinolophus ferrumequinum TaxID=59479 RepID=A0A7J7S868_RHIFE|nr:hypothetical protein mRhiFer1_009247 [Rhinolophus ferrumequinum]
MNSKCPPSQSPKTLLYRLPSQVTVQGPQNLTLLHPDRLMAPSCPPHSRFAFTVSSASLFSSCPPNFLALPPSPLPSRMSSPSSLTNPPSSHSLFVNNNNNDPLHTPPRALYYLEIFPPSHIFSQPLGDNFGRQP